MELETRRCERVLRDNGIKVEGGIPLTNQEYIQFLSNRCSPGNAAVPELRMYPERLFRLAGTRGTFGERLKVSRQIIQCTQPDLVKKIGVTTPGPSPVSRYEDLDSCKNIESARVAALAKALSVPLDWLESGGVTVAGYQQEPRPSFMDGYALAMDTARWWWLAHCYEAFDRNISLRTSADHELASFLVHWAARVQKSEHNAYPLLQYFPWCLPVLREALVTELLFNDAHSHLRLSFEDYEILSWSARHHASPLVTGALNRIEPRHENGAFLETGADHRNALALLRAGPNLALRQHVSGLAVPGFDPEWLEVAQEQESAKPATKP